jgi:hypothetical protein
MKLRTLVNAHGSFVRFMVSDEAQRLERSGEIRRINRRVYKLVQPPPPPSASKASPAQLTNADMTALATLAFPDGRINSYRRERLIGYGLIPMPKEPIDRRETRAAYYEIPELVEA